MASSKIRNAPSAKACLAGFVAAVLSAASPTFAACGVAQLEIDTQGMSDTFCTRTAGNVIPGCQPPPTPPAFECPGNSFAIQCPLGAFVPDEGLDFMGLAFEVRATLTAGSTPTDCAQGQLVQSTTTLDGSLQQPNPASQPAPVALPAGLQAVIDVAIVTAPTPIPQIGEGNPGGQQVYGADNFVAPLNEGGVGPNLLYWIDAPSIGVDGNALIVEQNRFLSFVAGSTGTPDDSQWCGFVVQRTFGGGSNDTAVQPSGPSSAQCTIHELPPLGAATEPEPEPDTKRPKGADDGV